MTVTTTKRHQPRCRYVMTISSKQICLGFIIILKGGVNMTQKVNGVLWVSNKQKWIANISVHSKKIFLGQFTDEASAIRVRQDAEQTLKEMTHASKEEKWSKMKKIKEKHNPKPKRNIIGDKIGRLTVIGKAQTRKETYQHNGVVSQRNLKYYTCKCDCGNTIEVREANLIYNDKQKSCGCIKRENFRNLGLKSRKDISGNKYGKLTAVKPLNKTKKNEHVWLCQCDCGNNVEVRIGHLTDGGTQSCGCIQKEMMSKRIGPMNIKKITQFSVDHTNLMHIDPNKKIPKNNTSGTIGVRLNKGKDKWQAFIGFQNKTYYLGTYENKDMAINARKEAEAILYQPMLDKHSDLTTKMKELKQKKKK